MKSIYTTDLTVRDNRATVAAECGVAGEGTVVLGGQIG